MSQTRMNLVLTNIGPKPCVIGGFPGVSFVDAAARQLGLAADRGGPAGGAITLASGQRAVASLDIVKATVFCDPGEGQTRSAAGLRVYPPENRAALVLPWSDQVCTSGSFHQITVGAFTR